MSKEHKNKSRTPAISFINWFITLIVSLIPGANILFFIFTIALARTPSKRNFAIAALVLALVIGIALAVTLFWFSDSLIDFFNKILAEASPAEAV